MRVHTFLAVEALTFGMASLIHAGVLPGGQPHHAAMVVEAAIGLVLTLGLLVVIADLRATRAVGAAVQILAMVGAFAGIFAIVVGVGPQSRLDLLLHGMFVLLLAVGLTITMARPTVT